MAREINLKCTGCGNGVFLEEPAFAASCSRCHRAATAPYLRPDAEPLEACAGCQRRDLYRQRDFNRNLGAAVAVVACLAAFVLFLKDAWFWALGTLVAAAAVDLVLYLVLAQVAVCYACGAIHRGFTLHPGIQGFNLVVADRYEQRTGGPVAGAH